MRENHLHRAPRAAVFDYENNERNAKGDLTSFVSHLQQPAIALFVFHNINALIERNA